MPRFARPAATLVFLPVFLFALAGCGSSTLPAPSVEGLWTGTLTDSAGQPGAATLSLTEDRHGVLHGSFSFLAGACSANANSVIGKIAALQLSLSQAPSDPVATNLQLVMNSTDQQLAGTYSNNSGVCASNGTIQLSKPINQTLN